MIHYQRPVPGHLEAVDKLPPGAWVKSVDDQALTRELKLRRPDINIVFRHEYTQQQNPSNDYEVNKDKARAFFASFIDGTFWQEQFYLYMDAIEEWNEYLANSQDENERAIWLSWCAAVCDVWYNELCVQHVELNSIRLVLCNTAIGNDIDPRFALIAYSYNDRPNPPIMGYHSYCLVNDGEIHPDNDTWLSNRWAALMDPAFLDAGYEVDWLFTEAGAYRGVLDGWRHPQVYAGNLDAYIYGALTYQLDSIAEFNTANDDRALGFALFTTGNIDPWGDYELGTPELTEMAEYYAAYVPPVQPPPEPPPMTRKHIMTTVTRKMPYHQNGNQARELVISAHDIDGKRLGSVTLPLSAGVHALRFNYFTGRDGNILRPLGCDVSHWQGAINFQTMKSAGAHYCFIKATEHIGHTDTRFAENWPAAKDAGLLRGAYHFYRFAYNPVDQANHFLDTVGADLGELPLVVDVEDQQTAPDADALKRFIDHIELLTGVRCLIYTGSWWWPRIAPVPWAKEYGLWEAEYTHDPTGDPTIHPDWDDWRFWQYSNEGDGPTYGASSERIDLNVYNGYLSELTGD